MNFPRILCTLLSLVLIWKTTVNVIKFEISGLLWYLQQMRFNFLVYKLVFLVLLIFQFRDGRTHSKILLYFRNRVFVDTMINWFDKLLSLVLRTSQSFFKNLFDDFGWQFMSIRHVRPSRSMSFWYSSRKLEILKNSKI